MLIPSYSAFLRFSDFAWRATFAAYGVYYEYLYEGIFTNGISDFKRLIIFNFICYLLIVYNAAVIIMAMGEGLFLSARYRKFNKSKKLGLKIITSAVINHDKDFLLKIGYGY